MTTVPPADTERRTDVLRSIGARLVEVPHLLVAVLVGGNLVWLIGHFVPAFVGPDAGAHYVQGRQMVEGLGPLLLAESPAQFIGNHWMELSEGVFVSRFPPGLASLLALFYFIGGPVGALLLIPLLAPVSILLVYLVTRHFASPWMAFGAALVAATMPAANRFALHNDSSTVTVVCVLVGMWLLARWDAAPSGRRALVLGLVFGMLPVLRYAEAVFAIPVGAFLLIRAFERPALRPQVLKAVLAALVPMAFLGTYNWVNHGLPWVTGYSFSGESAAFTLAAYFEHTPEHLRAIFSVHGLGVFGVIGIVGMLLMLFDRRWRAWGVFGVTAVLAVTGLYGAYYWPADGRDALALRFFVPMLPVLLLSAVWALSRIPWNRGRLPIAFAAIALQATIGTIHSKDALIEEWRQSSHALALSTGIHGSVPVGSIIIGPRPALEVLAFEGRWRLVADWLFPGAPERERRVLTWDVEPEVAAILGSSFGPIQLDKFATSRRHYVGLENEGLADEVWSDVRDWAGGRNTYWLGRPDDVMRMTAFLPSLVVTHVGRLLMPEGGREMTNWVPVGPLHLYHLVERPADPVPTDR